VTPPDAAPAKPPLPTPPAGMALVLHPDGTPWFFVDANPVPHGAYCKVFPKQKKPSPKLDPQPVTGVAYNFARAFAQATQKRLLTDEEYQAALATPGVEAAPAGMWEWVDAPSGSDEKKSVRQAGKKATRPQTGQKDVTFRLGADVH
jgi:formylglycine-generating enzyme required for sulfatase activity